MTSITTQIDGIRPAYKEASVAWVAFLMCVLGAVFYCYEYYLRVAPSVIQPQLMQTFNVSQSGLGVLISYYYLAYVPLQIPVGLMMDFWGPRRVLTMACLMCAIGTYIFAGTDLIWAAKIGRFMVGFGSAFAYIGVLKIANIWLPRKYFAMMAGLCTALGMFGAMSGGILMSKFVDITGWQQTLYSSAFVGLILAIILWVIIRDKSDREFISLGRASHQGISVWKELLEVVRSKQLWINGMIGCLTFLPLTAFAEFWSVSYLENIGLSKDYAAIGSSLVFLGFALGGPIWGRTSDLIKSRRTPLLLGSISSAFVACILLTMPAKSVFLLFTVLFLLGFLASAQVLVFAVGEDSCRPGMSATTVSFTNFIVMLGGFVLQPLVGIFLDFIRVYNSQGSLWPSLFDFKLALLILPIGLLLASGLCLFLKESYNFKSQEG
jgi:MFS family permease